MEAAALNNLGEVERLAGEDETAAQYYDASLQIYQHQGARRRARD